MLYDLQHLQTSYAILLPDMIAPGTGKLEKAYAFFCPDRGIAYTQFYVDEFGGMRSNTRYTPKEHQEFIIEKLLSVNWFKV
jgi:hypothetical protein